MDRGAPTPAAPRDRYGPGSSGRSGLLRSGRHGAAHRVSHARGLLLRGTAALRGVRADAAIRCTAEAGERRAALVPPPVVGGVPGRRSRQLDGRLLRGGGRAGSLGGRRARLRRPGDHGAGCGSVAVGGHRRRVEQREWNLPPAPASLTTSPSRASGPSCGPHRLPATLQARLRLRRLRHVRLGVQPTLRAGPRVHGTRRGGAVRTPRAHFAARILAFRASGGAARRARALSALARGWRGGCSAGPLLRVPRAVDIASRARRWRPDASARPVVAAPRLVDLPNLGDEPKTAALATRVKMDVRRVPAGDPNTMPRNYEGSCDLTLVTASLVSYMARCA